MARETAGLAFAARGTGLSAGEAILCMAGLVKGSGRERGEVQEGV